ncbi:hypothetical protein Q8A73_009276 [Channa argus]|nr:hypothetical protein Q8A73_009272 [Channa argus]KAK2908203.1 hypothetical protein Q8A73_009276 [Channa argus]
MMLWSLLLISLMAFCNTQNLIKGGKTNQTSYYTAEGVKYSSERATDGNLTQCAHSQQTNNSWWNIDLLGLYEISNITIYNVDSGNVNLTGAEIRIGNLSETDGTANSM